MSMPITPGLQELPRTHEGNTSGQAAATPVVESAAAVEEVARPCLSDLVENPHMSGFNGLSDHDLTIVSRVSKPFRAAVMEWARVTSINAMQVFKEVFSQSKLLSEWSSFHIFAPEQLENCSVHMLQLNTLNRRVRRDEVIDLLVELSEDLYNNIKMHFSHNRLPLGLEDVFRRADAKRPRRPQLQFAPAAWRMDPDMVAAAVGQIVGNQLDPRNWAAALPDMGGFAALFARPVEAFIAVLDRDQESMADILDEMPD